MQRLVYSPSVKVWVKADSGIIDLSPYVVDCNVNRKVNALSTAEVKFRNPKVVQDGKSRFMFTEHLEDGKVLPVFHPMDPITITFERIAGRPIQVFTGYCDSTPDVQLFPGTAKITASCTLKRLNYTYWDPALPFVTKFMQNYGWQVNQQTGQVGTDPATDPNTNAVLKNSTSNLNDSSIGNLVYAVLNEIGGWDPSNIYIQPLPAGIVSRVTNLFNEFVKENKSQVDEVQKLLKDIIGNGAFGSSTAGGVSQGTGGIASLSGPVANEHQIVNTIRNTANAHNIPPDFPLAVAIVETGLGTAVDNRQHFGTGKNDWYQWTVNGVPADPYAGQPKVDWTKGYDLGYSCSKFCEAAKLRSGVWQGVNWKSKGYPTWARVVQLSPGNSHDPDYGGANTDPKGNHLYSDAVFPSYVAEAQALLAKYPD